MRKIIYELDIGYAGCNEEDVCEVPDHLSDADIDEMVHEMALEHAASWEGDERLGFGNEDEDQEEVTTAFYEGVSSSWRWYNEEEEDA